MIIKEIQRKYKDADDFRFDRVGNKFEEGNTFMVEYSSADIKKEHAWFYAYVDKTGCQLFTDGEAAITHMQTLLDQKRGFLQRVKDFDFLDIIGALIALPITVTFVVIVLRANGAENAVSKEFLTIVSLILGYYFGRNKSK
jgi:hypothetical protein